MTVSADFCVFELLGADGEDVESCFITQFSDGGRVFEHFCKCSALNGKVLMSMD